MTTCTCSSSHASVTSKKSLSSLNSPDQGPLSSNNDQWPSLIMVNYSLLALNSRKAQLMLLSKSFHRRQNFSEDISVVGQDKVNTLSLLSCSEKVEESHYFISHHNSANITEQCQYHWMVSMLLRIYPLVILVIRSWFYRALRWLWTQSSFIYIIDSFISEQYSDSQFLRFWIDVCLVS